MASDFGALILTHGRPDSVHTYNTLRRDGYTGPIRLVVDDLDKTRDRYIERYGDEVVVFDKRAAAATFDQGDNFNDLRAIIYARNASFGIAKAQGFKSFIQLDDDYTAFSHRYDKRFSYATREIKKLDQVFAALVAFQDASGCDSVAFAQGGDFIGGPLNKSTAAGVKLLRKCMNSFVCRVDRPFQFIGRVNEDVNTYTRAASTGLLLFTANQVSLTQVATQSNRGGMTEMYLDSGTYVKSFYSVMYQPSSVTVQMLVDRNARLHHAVSWRNTVPKILSESLRRPQPATV